MTPTAWYVGMRYTNVNQCRFAEEMTDDAYYKATPVLLRACAMVQAFRLIAHFSDLNRDTIGRPRPHAPSHPIIAWFRSFVKTFFANFFKIIFPKTIDFWLQCAIIVSERQRVSDGCGESAGQPPLGFEPLPLSCRWCERFGRQADCGGSIPSPPIRKKLLTN